MLTVASNKMIKTSEKRNGCDFAYMTDLRKRMAHRNCEAWLVYSGGGVAFQGAQPQHCCTKSVALSVTLVFSLVFASYSLITSGASSFESKGRSKTGSLRSARQVKHETRPAKPHVGEEDGF